MYSNLVRSTLENEPGREQKNAAALKNCLQNVSALASKQNVFTVEYVNTTYAFHMFDDQKR